MYDNVQNYSLYNMKLHIILGEVSEFDQAILERLI